MAVKKKQTKTGTGSKPVTGKTAASTKKTKEKKKAKVRVDPITGQDMPSKEQVYNSIAGMVDLEEMPNPMDMWDKPQGLHKVPSKGLAVLLVAMMRRHVNIKTALAAAGVPNSAATAWMQDAVKNPKGDAARLLSVLQMTAAQAEVNLISLINVNREFRNFAWVAERRYGARWNIEGETEVDLQPVAEPPKITQSQGSDLLDLMKKLNVSAPPEAIEVEAERSEEKKSESTNV